MRIILNRHILDRTSRDVKRGFFASLRMTGRRGFFGLRPQNDGGVILTLSAAKGKDPVFKERILRFAQNDGEERILRPSASE